MPLSVLDSSFTVKIDVLAMPLSAKFSSRLPSVLKRIVVKSSSLPFQL